MLHFASTLRDLRVKADRASSPIKGRAFASFLVAEGEVLLWWL